MSTLTYDFRVIGLDAIDRAFSSVEQRMATHNARVTRTTGVRAARGSGTNLVAQAERDAAKAAAKAERDAAKAAERAEKARLRAIEKGLRDEERLRLRQAREIARKEEQIAREAARREAATTRAAALKSEKFRREMGGAVVRGVKGVGSAAMTATGLAGGAWLTAATYGAVRQEDAVRRLLINSRGAGQSQLMKPEELQGRIRSASIGTGVGEGDITEGLSQFVARTGDLKTGVEMMQTLAQTAAASGASFEDLSGVAADLMTKFDVTKVEDMQDALAGLVFQGKAGAFELRDMADQFPKIGAMAKSMGMGGAGGLRKVGALAQIVRGSTGNAETATFALDAMTRQLVSKGADMGSGKAFGGKKVNVFKNGDPTQGLRDITELIPEVLAASNGNLAQLQETFGGEGMRGMNAFLGTFRGAGGGAAGTAAVRQQIAESVNSGGSWSEVQRDASSAMQSTASQLEALNTQMKAAVETDLLPALKELIPQVIKLAPYVGDAVKSLAKFVGWAATNPWVAITGLVAANIGKAIVSAKIGDLLADKLGNKFGGSIAVAAASFAITSATIEVASEAAAKGQGQAATLNARMGTVNAQAQRELSQNGSISDETMKQMRALQNEASTVTRYADQGLFGSIANSAFGTGPGFSAYVQGLSANSAMSEGGANSAAAEEGRMAAYIKLGEAADKISTAADKIAAGGGASAPGSLNRGQSPTTPG